MTLIDIILIGASVVLVYIFWRILKNHPRKNKHQQPTWQQDLSRDSYTEPVPDAVVRDIPKNIEQPSEHGKHTEPDTDNNQQQSAKQETSHSPATTGEEPTGAKRQSPPKTAQAQAPEEGQAPRMAEQGGGFEDHIVINVISAHQPITGTDLLKIIGEANMVFGDFHIFHKYNTLGEIDFSILDAVEPGTFDPNRMHELRTEGVTLFLTIQDAPDPSQSLQDMYALAQKIAEHFGAALKDENHEVMTEQKLAQYQQAALAYQKQKGGNFASSSPS